MFIHDIIKIRYVNTGYLPNYPYYLISDSEMIEAFLKENGYFDDFYPCPGEELEEAYNTLRASIEEKLNAFLEDPENNSIPDWVYSYMLMRPITYQSDEEDIYYLYDLTGVNSGDVEPEFTLELAKACYKTSQEWMRKKPSQNKDRPPTMFGETHVTKCLRLKQANILLEVEGV